MSSIWSSLSGIRAHQFMLDVIGNNLANANTTGFKSSRVTFSEMMNQTLQPASSGTNTLGGTNPVQIGMGVEIGSIVRDFSQGRLQDTGNPLDLSMDGNGFMVLNDGSHNVFSRSMTLSIDSSSNLVDAATGYRLMSVENVPIHIPYSEQIPAQKTESITLAGNLTTAAGTPQREVLASITPATAGGVAATAATSLNALDSTSVPYADGDTISIQAVDVNGEALPTATFTYGAANDGTTMGDLLDSINTMYAGTATASLDADGNLLLSAEETGPATLSISILNDTGAGTTDWPQHAMFVQSEGANGDSHNVAATIYDSRGDAHILTFKFERISEREWSMNASMGDDSGTLTKSTITNIRFNTDGSFNSVGAGGIDAQQITIDFGNSAETQAVSIELGTGAKFDGLTLFGGTSTAAAMRQDGYAPGTLKSFTINRDGTIEGMYTNGQRRDLAQVQIATFDNPEGLETSGHGMWGATVNSGDPIYGTAMSGRAGAIVSSALEGSNVESASELTKLIIAQHGFQMSSRAMSVSSRIIQELAQTL